MFGRKARRIKELEEELKEANEANYKLYAKLQNLLEDNKIFKTQINVLKSKLNALERIDQQAKDEASKKKSSKSHKSK